MSYQGYTILLNLISYFLFFALLWLSKELNGNRLLDKNGVVSNPSILIALHIGGIILFGMLPLLSNHPSSSSHYGRYPIGSLPTWITVFLMLILSIFAPRIAKTKLKEVERNAPVNTSFNIVFAITYFLIRILFICSYESWFRGYLLKDCILRFGEPPAILLNVSLYSLLHLVNGKDEILACIPFGFLLCVLCIWQGSAWPAILIHLALTIPYEISFILKIKSQTAAI
jgi:membrane protease YdiL (CAAX protease family)